MSRTIRNAAVRFRLVAAAAVLVMGLAARPARAALIFSLGDTFNGVTPSSTPPYLTAKFEDTGTTDQVQLTLTASLNVSTEFIGDVTFNVDPTIVPSSLTIVQSPIVNPSPSSYDKTTQNAQQVTGGGNPGKNFDVKINWSTAAGVGRFDGTDMVMLLITGSGIDENSFKFANADGWYMAAHVQGVPDLNNPGQTASGAVGTKPISTTGDLVPVPEPATLGLIGLGLTFGARQLRRR